jgi:16S rRNA processing protein RimM
MIADDKVYKIGVIGKPHGVKGEVTFRFNDDIFDTSDSDFLILKIDGILVPFFIEEYRFRSDETALMKFEDIDTLERASELTGCEVYFLREHAERSGVPITLARIVGYQIIDSSTHNIIGVIASVDDSTSNILFELEDGRLIPVAEEWIKEIDNNAKQIVMSLPEGLLDL